MFKVTSRIVGKSRAILEAIVSWSYLWVSFCYFIWKGLLIKEQIPSSSGMSSHPIKLIKIDDRIISRSYWLKLGIIFFKSSRIRQRYILIITDWTILTAVLISYFLLHNDTKKLQIIPNQFSQVTSVLANKFASDSAIMVTSA